MTPTTQTAISRQIARECDENMNYQFQERSGMCIDAGLSVEEADSETYRQLFGREWKE